MGRPGCNFPICGTEKRNAVFEFNVGKGFTCEGNKQSRGPVG